MQRSCNKIVLVNWQEHKVSMSLWIRLCNHTYIHTYNQGGWGWGGAGNSQTHQKKAAKPFKFAAAAGCAGMCYCMWCRTTLIVTIIKIITIIVSPLTIDSNRLMQV